MDNHVVERFASFLAKLDRLGDRIDFLLDVYRQGLITAEELEEEVKCDPAVQFVLAFVLF